MEDTDRRALTKRAAERLLRIPGVHSVGIGGREKGGRPTGELVLKVFVERKRPLAEIQASEVIPPEFEGLRTDVVQTGRFRASVGGRRPFRDAERLQRGDQFRYRPIRGGTQLQADGTSLVGTLGFLATVPANPKDIMAVTCHHVMFTADAPVIGRKAGQADPSESCTKCCASRIGLIAASHYDADVDATLIRLDPELEWVAEIEQIGFLRGPHTVTEAEATPLTYEVRQRGRTLRLTGGTVQAINAPGSAEPAPGTTLSVRPYTNAIMIKPNPSDDDESETVWFAQEGDSGSAVVNDNNEVIGVLFAVSAEGWGAVTPIADVISKFTSADSITIAVATATALGDVRKVPKRSAELGATDPVTVPAAARRIEADLDRTVRGRELIALWLRHSNELNRLVNTNRRVAAAWRMANGPALFREIVYAPDVASRPLPTIINGEPADIALARFLREADHAASAELRLDLERHRGFLFSLPGRSYEDVLRELQ
jgi:hypothetical protein